MAISEPTYEFRVDRNVPVPMRDGTVLRADVYRPRTEGVFPVLVGRVGYRLRDWPMDFYTPHWRVLCPAGVRGRVAERAWNLCLGRTVPSFYG